ncbi:MAG: hypothetical protein DME18_05650 [Verrucomicrobia bacterium]|nr:MAG: hypothetical protein DME18_05650 [Verrucomicrobiota bacterium]
MSNSPAPLDLKKLKVFPLAERDSQSRVEEILVEAADDPPPCPERVSGIIQDCARKTRAALKRNSAVMLIYGAHLVKNGGQLLLNRMMERGWLTHLATNGAGIIHDWEFSFLGRSTESVRDNVAGGRFGTWDETGRYIHLALLAGALRSEGFGRSLGRFVHEDGTTLPTVESLEKLLRDEPSHPLTPARADLLLAMRAHQLPPGRHMVPHRFRNACVLANAFRQEIPFTVHPGIGYDIISNHPMFNGAALGRAAEIDFRLFGAAVERLDGGVVLSVGSAIMGPQVFEKSLSCVNNLRLQNGRPVVRDHTIYVVDLQDGGNWDWTQGEPPKDNPAYYLRFCKSYSRMGGTMHYVQCDNVLFLHHLFRALREV